MEPIKGDDMAKLVKILVVAALVAGAGLATLGAMTPANACGQSGALPCLTISADRLGISPFFGKTLCDGPGVSFSTKFACAALLDAIAHRPPVPNASGVCAGQDVNPMDNEASKAAAEWAVVCLVNQWRIRQTAEDGIARPMLTIDVSLARAARLHAEDIGRRKACPNGSHIGADGSSFSVRDGRAGYTGFALNENVVWCCYTPRGSVEAWASERSLTDPSQRGHWVAMINPAATETGAGVGMLSCWSGWTGSHTYVQDFGTR